MSSSSESQRIRRAIFDLLQARKPGKTICPSEAAKKLYPGESWREKMADVRAEAVRLAEAGDLEITQKGVPVDPRHLRGPIRLRLTHQAEQ